MKREAYFYRKILFLNTISTLNVLMAVVTEVELVETFDLRFAVLAPTTAPTGPNNTKKHFKMMNKLLGKKEL
jgi:hypothetical protein